MKSVRATTAQSFERFRELVIEYDNSLPADLRHSDFAQQVESLAQDYAPPSAAFIAFAGEEPAGCIAVKQLDESTAIIKKLYVKPAYRNRGFARALVGAATEFARSMHYSRLVLDTERRRLSAAHALYVALGFEDCEPYGAVDYASPTFMQLRL